MIDFHSHFLPGIDDGAKNINETISMIQAWMNQGIDNICATPHFYADSNTPERFLANRKNAYDNLRRAVSNTPREIQAQFPGVMLGAEVHYFDGISHFDGLNQLCFEGTDLVLLEMPFRTWTDRILEEVARIPATMGIMPIAAHIERYFEQPLFEEFMELNIFYQSNAEFFYDRKTSRKACKLLKSGTITFIGSDAHNTTTRPVDIGYAADVINKTLGDQFLVDLTERQYSIIMDYASTDI